MSTPQGTDLQEADLPDLAELARWTPIRLDLGGPAPGDREATVTWGDLQGVRFEEPFFSQTVQRWTAGESGTGEAARRTLRTGIAALSVLDQAGQSLDPAGFIFHISRCGSTLASRLLAKAPGAVVISEADPVNALLEAEGEEVEDDALILALRLVIRALGRRRFGDERHLFVKFSSWNVRRLDLLRAAFPDVPWIWLYREPEAVLASLLRQPPGWVALQQAPERARSLLGVEQAETLSRADFCAEAVAGFCRSALDAGDRFQHFLRYGDLPDAVWEVLAPDFGLPLAEADISQMRAEARFYAKTPGRHVFQGDPAVAPDAEQAGAERLARLRELAAEMDARR